MYLNNITKKEYAYIGTYNNLEIMWVFKKYNWEVTDNIILSEEPRNMYINILYNNICGVEYEDLEI